MEETGNIYLQDISLTTSIEIQKMASLDNNPTSHRTGALLRRHGSTPGIRNPRAISSWSIMARDACRRGCSRAANRRVHAGAV